jgi:hypothetical protein
MLVTVTAHNVMKRAYTMTTHTFAQLVYYFFSSLIRQRNNGRRRRLIGSGSFYDCAHTGHVSRSTLSNK